MRRSWISSQVVNFPLVREEHLRSMPLSTSPFSNLPREDELGPFWTLILWLLTTPLLWTALEAGGGGRCIHNAEPLKILEKLGFLLKSKALSLAS